MIASLSHNLKGLISFSGRENRALFWPYAACVALLMFAGFAAAVWPEVGQSIARMQRFAAEHPDEATITSEGGSYSISIRGYHPELMPNFARLLTPIAAIGILGVALLAAAVARRLHDRERSGAWGLLPLPFLVGGLMLFGKILTGVTTNEPFNLTLFFVLFLNNLLYVAALIFLIVQLAGPSSPNPNSSADGRVA